MKRNTLDNMFKGECRYEEKCYRKNPIHFQEYSHRHLTDILKNTPEDCEFVIPRHLLACQEIISEQLNILLQHNIVSNKKTRITIKTPQAINDTPQTSNFKNNSIPEFDVPNIGSIVAEETKLNNKFELNNISEDFIGSETNNFDTNDKFLCDAIAYDCDKNESSNIRNNEESQNIKRNRSPRRGNVKAEEIFNVVAPSGKFAEKLAAASPYNFFLTTVTANPITHNEPLSVTFTELLDRSLGDLESSVQINFMVDLPWLLAHYVVSGNRDTQLLILYGEETDELRDINRKSKNIQTIQVKMGSAFGKHHTKMSLLGYKDGSMRVVVSTANLYEDDWENRTQGLWISPSLPCIESVWDTRIGESETGFRDDLLRYLISYKIPQLQPWIARIRKTDFSAIKVFLIASVPGSHRGIDVARYGHRKLATLLSTHANPDTSSKDYVIAQSSSIGSLGPNKDSWVGGEFLTSATRTKPQSSNTGISMKLLESRPLIKMIYPSLANVKASHDGLMGGGCLPYNVKTHSKQTWLTTILHQWRAKNRNRSKAMPHIKSYCRISIKEEKIVGLHWFLVTSANLSKAAWGVLNKTSGVSDPPLRIMSYEAGVLFLPQFVIQSDVLPLQNGTLAGPVFPMPYDLPLTQYNPDDTPFFMDLLAG